jgi:hypothetical protein
MKTKCMGIIIMSPGKKVKVHNNEHICLTLQCWAWCHIQTSNSSHVAGLSVLYGSECVQGTINLKAPPSWAVVGI